MYEYIHCIYVYNIYCICMIICIIQLIILTSTVAEELPSIYRIALEVKEKMSVENMYACRYIS